MQEMEKLAAHLTKQTKGEREITNRSRLNSEGKKSLFEITSFNYLQYKFLNTSNLEEHF